jgi:hypothetical protein
MKVFLAGQSSYLDLDWEKCKYNLESFWYFKPEQEKYLKKWKMFLLDSGAFTFMSGTGKTNFDEYLTKYIEFINKYDIKYFFELDVDSVVGYEKVKEYRKRLEKETGKKCIPVWHKSRGKYEFLRLCENYKYIAIGGIVTKEIKPDEYKYFSWFIDEAHKRNCKIHGLGFTKTKQLEKTKFDSVDSTTWNRGRFGDLYIFDNGKMKTKKKKGTRLKDGKKANAFCLEQWIKYQHYADKNL